MNIYGRLFRNLKNDKRKREHRTKSSSDNFVPVAEIAERENNTVIPFRRKKIDEPK